MALWYAPQSVSAASAFCLMPHLEDPMHHIGVGGVSNVDIDGKNTL